MGKEISRQRLASGKFLCLERILWRDDQGRDGVWEVAVRTTPRPAALMITWLHPSERLVLIRQYRPPARGEVIEFPAGLMDEGETPGSAALRELLEETGYHGQVTRILPAAYNTPGLSSERTHLVLVEVDETLPENREPVPRHEIGEEITVVLVEKGSLREFLSKEEAVGTQFDSKVLSYLATLL